MRTFKCWMLLEFAHNRYNRREGTHVYIEAVRIIDLRHQADIGHRNLVTETVLASC